MIYSTFAPTTLIASGVLALFLAWLSIVDIREFRIPDLASLSLAVLGLMSSFVLDVTQPIDALLGAVLGYGIFALLGAAYFQLDGQEGLGLGDAKLLAAAGAWLGWRDLPMLIALSAGSALVFALITRRSRIAFGPWLAAAFWIIWITRLHAYGAFGLS